MATAAILIVEDDSYLVDALRVHIEALGYALDHAATGEQGLEMAVARAYALVILDLNVPKLHGLEVCRRLREHDRRLPILILSAQHEEIDKVLALELGADDYLTKPFSVRELLARIKALLRRSRGAPPPGEGEVLTRGALQIDTTMRTVTRNGKGVALTPIEFDLLAFLARQPGRPFTREQLIREVWGYTGSGYARTVNTCVNRLRTKLEDDAEDPQFIESVRGIGYRFRS